MKCITVIVLLSMNAVGHSAETKEIPLDQIWAYEMPGTREIEELIKEGDMEAKPDEALSPDEEITIVFFSEPVGGNRGQIRHVERKGNKIKIG